MLSNIECKQEHKKWYQFKQSLHLFDCLVRCHCMQSSISHIDVKAKIELFRTWQLTRTDTQSDWASERETERNTCEVKYFNEKTQMQIDWDIRWMCIEIDPILNENEIAHDDDSHRITSHRKQLKRSVYKMNELQIRYLIPYWNWPCSPALIVLNKFFLFCVVSLLVLSFNYSIELLVCNAVHVACLVLSWVWLQFLFLN